MQGGYSANLAPGKLVGKLLNLFDSTAHLVVGGLPPPAQSISKQNNSQNEHDRQKPGPRVSNSQSTMAMSSLVPSSSVEPMSEWTGGTNRMKISNRCASEPDFGKSPRKVCLHFRCPSTSLLDIMLLSASSLGIEFSLLLFFFG